MPYDDPDEGTMNATVARRIMESTSALRLNGMQVVISEHVPKNLVGHEIAPVYPHWLKRLWLRALRREVLPVRFKPVSRIEEEQVVRMGNKLVMSAAAWQQVKAYA